MAYSNIMPLPNITMVALLGPKKPDSLIDLLSAVFSQIEKYPNSNSLRKYDLAQIHATMIGMEINLQDGKFFSHWNKKNLEKNVEINTKLFIQYFNIKSPLFAIRFGGFSPAYCRCKNDDLKDWDCRSSPGEFHSCQRTPYEGSFYVCQNGDVMLTGWPVQSIHQLDIFPHSLFQFRKDAEKAGFLDKYHGNQYPFWKDDDFYLKIGTFKNKLKSTTDLEKNIRQFLSTLSPVVIEIMKEDVKILLYRSSALQPKDILASVSLSDAINDPSLVFNLYKSLL